MTDPRPPAERAKLAQSEATTPAAPAELPPPPMPRPVALRHYSWLAGAAIVLLLALHWLGPVLTPFLIGAIFSYIGLPLVDRMERRRFSRTLGALLVILIIGVAVTAFVLVVVPLLQAEVIATAHKLPDLLARTNAQVSPWLQDRLGIDFSFDAQSVRDYLANNTDDVRAMSLRVLAEVKTGGRIILSLLVNAALIPVVMFYLLRDWHLIFRRLYDLVPRRWDEETAAITGEIDNVLAEFLHGQVLVMGVLALYYSIALSVVRLDHALPIGILTGLLVFIPYVGFGLGLTLGMLAAILQWSGWPGFFAVAAVYGVGQLLENYVLVPYLVGDRIGLHPLAVIFSLLAFGQLFGFAGVLLALPVSAALLVGLRHVRGAYVASPIYRKD